MPEGGELVNFENQTNEKLSVESWSWNFGDPGSGANNLSKMLDPIHHYQEPGLKNHHPEGSHIGWLYCFICMETLIDSKPVA